jgi:hypothetical protein
VDPFRAVNSNVLTPPEWARGTTVSAKSLEGLSRPAQALGPPRRQTTWTAGVRRVLGTSVRSNEGLKGLGRNSMRDPVHLVRARVRARASVGGEPRAFQGPALQHSGPGAFGPRSGAGAGQRFIGEQRGFQGPALQRGPMAGGGRMPSTTGMAPRGGRGGRE